MAGGVGQEPCRRQHAAAGLSALGQDRLPASWLQGWHLTYLCFGTSGWLMLWGTSYGSGVRMGSPAEGYGLSAAEECEEFHGEEDEICAFPTEGNQVLAEDLAMFYTHGQLPAWRACM